MKRTFGLQKTSLIDYPGKVACVLFSRGCNLRCPYCHNPELVEGPEPKGMENWDEILRFLSKRKNVLEGVCISGGEPLLIKELPDLIQEIHSLQYFVKVDTNGTNPQGLEKLEADFVAMDFKTSPEKYSLVGGSPETAKAVSESARILIKRKVPHEFRITVAPEIFEESDAPTIARILKGTENVILTGVRLSGVLDPAYGSRVSPYPLEYLQKIRSIFLSEGVPCRIRGDLAV